ncbi:MAG: hypothetical protein U0746_00225 [Gemmataceae bacterium]
MTLPRLRAPVDNGSILAVPPLASVGEAITANREKLSDLSERRREAWEDVLDEAVNYHARWDQFNPTTCPRAIVAGHQPDLFHPGVWLKNYALAKIACDHHALAFNLIADTDTLRSPSIHVPTGVGSDDPASVRFATIAYDVAGPETPYEERCIRDHAMFRSFGERVLNATKGWGYEPFITEFWPAVLENADKSDNIGECFAAARRTVERKWGVRNYELPTSRIAQTRGFRQYAASVLSDLPRFHATYNTCLSDYRRKHRIRSRNHPVPDLGQDGDWLETPFWGWRRGSVSRGRLFARRAGQRIELRASGEVWPDGELEGLEGRGFKLRPRALSLTMFARLYLADLFVHGIGGGKYDELTDAIIARHFRVMPPTYLVLTGTLRPPFTGYSSTSADVRQLERLARDVRWNPQRHGANGATAARRRELAEANPTDPAAKLARFRNLRELTDALAPAVGQQLADARKALAGAKSEVAANAILRRRDYSFVLFPEATLREFLTSSAAQPASPPRPKPL